MFQIRKVFHGDHKYVNRSCGCYIVYSDTITITVYKISHDFS